jgi:flagellar motor switch protein FliM
MPEVLSQSQIDELLNGLSSGDIDYEQSQKEDSKKLKEYDFRSPKKLTKEHQKVLKSIYEHFARHLASYFSGILRTYCEISVASIEEQPYFEYNNALPDAVLIAVIDAKPIKGRF